MEFVSLPVPQEDQKAMVTGNLAKDWQDWSGWADLTAHYDIDNSNCHTEGSCQRIDISRLDSGYLTFAHWLRMPAGAYSADLWIRSSSRSNVIVALKNSDDSSGEQQFEPQKFLAGRAWKHVELSGRCPGWENADLTVSVLSGGASVWIDNVRLERRFDWVSLLTVLMVIAVSVGLTHFLDFVLSKVLAARKPSVQKQR
ncbi:hypothetical protein CCAX7_002610 [Capsulimonas corticalis]|uniref:Uncharacterized protein n=2 Tax=Capsulimonas corticalis TaxID=2219043 RepID=A0A402CRY6_9BACT|nr:hypothetical protein CCAX7_002610 [Capsulimonas corticalis]